MVRLRPEELGFGSAPPGGSLPIPGLHRCIRSPPEVRPDPMRRVRLSSVDFGFQKHAYSPDFVFARI